MRAWIMAVGLAACGAPPPAPPDVADDLCFDSQGPRAPRFANVQRIFDFQCTSCHGLHAPDLVAPSYAGLVGKPAVDDPPTLDSCGGTLVVPGDPATSYLYVKVSSDTPCAGSRMPRTEFDVGRLPNCQTELIRQWIAAGAAND